ncbi:hypothetical protein WG915_02470 [Corynebacterium sp. H128]|uniref:hypothetical protein n=1 Tax=Corynebacterium sp. H128 TaxID=3133427 RepID=UPI0030AB525C
MKLPPGTRTILIDGRSGSGKTTFAQRVAGQLGWQLVHMDDLYPGWNGLAAGSRLAASDVLRTENPGFFRWDWVAGSRGDWAPVDVDEPLVLEGVGALTTDTLRAANLRGAVLSIVLRCPASIRRQRALARDPEFAQWWEMWARQEQAHFAQLPTPDVVLDCRSIADFEVC